MLVKMIISLYSDGLLFKLILLQYSANETRMVKLLNSITFYSVRGGDNSGGDSVRCWPSGTGQAPSRLTQHRLSLRSGQSVQPVTASPLPAQHAGVWWWARPCLDLYNPLTRFL